MLNFTAADIRLGASFATRDEAIRAVAALLAERDAIDPAYAASMLRREQSSGTYLGNGVAIPHGQPQDAHLIRHTRIALLQIPAGVAWKGDEKARLIFGIAARSDEHLSLLVRLTSLTSDAALAERLATTTDAAEIVAAILADPASTAPTACTADHNGQRISFRFTNPRGFHLRPASQLAEAVRTMDGDVTLLANGRTADARSALAIVNLGITAGTTLELRASSPYADDHLRQLRRLLELLNEEPQEANSSDVDAPAAWQPAQPDAARTLTGTLAAPGIAVGPVFHWSLATGQTAARQRGDEAAELSALQVAVESAADTLRTLAADEGMNQVQRNLFSAHVALISDADLLDEARSLIRSGSDALSAWDSVLAARVTALAAVADAHIAQRSVDLQDAGHRVRRVLLGVDQDPLAVVSTPVILVADDLEPSEAAQLSPAKVCGICLRDGSPNAHSAIVARSLGIPMVVAVGAALAAAAQGDTAILDASGARLLLSPSAADIESACQSLKALDARRRRAWHSRFSPALLADGHRVEIVANIAKVSEAAEALKAGAEGVGLVRTEFLFLDRDHAPSEDEQYECYKAMVLALEGLPMVLRTIDIGGDKPVDYLGLNADDLSFLGLRGVRLGLARPDIIRTQLRAAYRAAAHGPIKLLFPMISTPNDFRRIRQIAESVRQEVSGPRLDLGVMIEVPSAVIMAPELARVADFFSVGTNDLTQYTLAVDRTHPLLAKRADSLHPAVLRLIKQAVEAAHAEGKWIGVCGGLAADVLGAQILTGLGIDELSMPPALIPAIKEKLRASRLSDLQNLASRALAQEHADAVRLLNAVS